MTEVNSDDFDVSSDVETPINLREVSKEQLTFYLTTKTPLPVSEFAEKCVQSETEVKQILRDRFRAETNIDATDFLELTGEARRPVIKAGKPYIKRGNELLNEGKSLSDKEKYEQTAVHFAQVAAMFESVLDRFATVNYEPEKLEKLITTVKGYHDSASKEAAKESINYQLLKRRQHESDGDQNTERNPPKAANEYQKALDAASEAIETALQYNQSRLQSDEGRLSVEPLKEEQESIKQKLQSLEKDVSGTSEQKVDADSNASPESPLAGSGSDDREAMLEVVRDLHKRLERIPKTTELPEACKYSPNDFYNEFGTWNEALEAAGIDKEQALLEDIERVTKKLGRVPNSGDMDEHGTYSGSSYSLYFDTWSAALEQSGVEENHKEGRDEKLLKRLRSLDESLNRLPKGSDFHDEAGISQHDYIQSFGSWDEALEAAGIDKEGALLEDIERVTKKLGHPPTTTEINEHGTYSNGYYSSTFDSWDAVLEEAGVKRKGVRNDKLLERLQSLHDRLDRLPKTTDLHNEAGISQHDYIQNFGSWDEALEAAGIDKQQHLINDLNHIAVEVDGKPAKTDANRLGNYSAAMHRIYFGSWEKALDAAGLSSMRTKSGKKQETKEQSSGTGAMAPSTPIVDIMSHIDSVGPQSISRLKSAGYTTLGELYNVEPRVIAKHKGIGQKKATELVRFATENISSTGISSEQSSKHRSETDRSPSSNLEDSSDRIQPSALDTSWETIPANKRIDGQFLLQVTSIDHQVGDRKTAQLDVRDQNGREFKVNIWSKHNVNREWNENEWYALENARGKVWESSDGTTRKQLSSTKDLEVIGLGANFNSDTASAGGTSKPEPEPQQPGMTTGEVGSESPSDSTTSAATTTDDEESGEDGSTEVDRDGVLDDIMSDFDEI